VVPDDDDVTWPFEVLDTERLGVEAVVLVPAPALAFTSPLEFPDSDEDSDELALIGINEEARSLETERTDCCVDVSGGLTARMTPTVMTKPVSTDIVLKNNLFL